MIHVCLFIMLSLKFNTTGPCAKGTEMWDGYRADILKNIKHTILQPLIHACNLSFANEVFPSELKIANVMPVLKPGDDIDFVSGG